MSGNLKEKGQESDLFRGTEPPKRKDLMAQFRKLKDTIMGILYILVAVALIWAEKNGYATFGLNFTYFLAAVMCLYGLFRIYRALILKR